MVSALPKQSELVTSIRGSLPDALLVALDQLGKPATLRQLALIVGAADSSVLYALRKLHEAELVRGTRGYELRLAPEIRSGVLFLAARRLGLRSALSAAARANPAVEFAALQRRAETLTIVYGTAASPTDVVRFEQFVTRTFPAVKLRAYDSERLRLGNIEAVDHVARIRSAVRRAVVLKGSTARSLPDRARRGRPTGARRLGRLHPSLRPLSRRARQDLAKRFGLGELSVFGSAVRSDFRPDSDVDVLVRLRPGRRVGLETLAGVKAELEEHFGRRVDVMDDASVPDQIRPLIERDKVKLYGWTHTKRLSSNTGKGVREAGD
jgi:predicted nucleotidyltransferase